MQNLQGKVAVVTGASSGAGRAIANALARKGMQVILAARRQEALYEVAAECKELGGKATVVVTDTRDAESMQQLAVKASEAGNGIIDVWINNAGVLAAGALEEIPANVNEAVVRTNLLGYIHGAHAVLPYFKKQGYGILINNISVGGWFPTPYMAAYSASKFGLRGFFESLKGELNSYPQIHVCDLYPAFLDTPGMQHSANYTGKNLQPAPPVYDPRKVANSVVQLLQRPQSKTTIGAASAFLRVSYLISPALSRNITANLIRGYLNKAQPIEPTSGNVLEPVEYGRGIDGGWRGMILKKSQKKNLWMAAGLFAAVMLLSKK